MTESEARKVFHDKLPLCDVLRLDVREACISAGVPAAMVDRLIADHAVKTAATTRCITDPSVMPASSPAALAAAPGNGGSREAGFLCLGQKLTGLPMIVWVLVGGASQGPPYLRVQADRSAAPRTEGSSRVSMEESPRQLQGPAIPESDFAAVQAFIRANRDALTAHWNGAGSAMGLMRKIVPVR